MARRLRRHGRTVNRMPVRNRQARQARPTPAAVAGPTGADMLSIGALTSAAQGASYYERDGYYAKDDPEHQDASGWAGKGAEELGLTGPVDP